MNREVTVAQLKRRLALFWCWFTAHKMVVVAEIVDWGYWDRLSQCERCGFEMTEFNYHPKH